MIGLLKSQLSARKKKNENKNNELEQSQSQSQPQLKRAETSLSASLLAAAVTTERVQNRLAEISELQQAENSNNNNDTNDNNLNWSDDDDDDGNDNDSDDNSLLDFSNRSSSSEEKNSKDDSDSQQDKHIRQQQQEQQEQEPSKKPFDTDSLSSSRGSEGSLDGELSQQLAPPPRASMIRADLLELSIISSAHTRSPSPDQSTTSSSDGLYYNHHQQHNVHWQQQRLLPASTGSASAAPAHGSSNIKMPPPLSSLSLPSAYPYADRPANPEMDDAVATKTDSHDASVSASRRQLRFSPLQNQQHEHVHHVHDYNGSDHNHGKNELSLSDQADYDDVLHRALLPDHPTTRSTNPSSASSRRTATTTARPIAMRGGVAWTSPWTRYAGPKTTTHTLDDATAAAPEATTAKSSTMRLDKQQYTVDTVMTKVAYVGLASSLAVTIWLGTVTNATTTTCTTQTIMFCTWTALATIATAVWSLYIVYVQYQVAKIPDLYRQQMALQQTLQQWKCTNTHERSRHMAAQAGIQRWKLLAGVPAGDYKQQNGATAAATGIATPTVTTPSSLSSPTIISVASIRRRHAVATELLAAKRTIRQHQRSQISKAIFAVIFHKRNARGPAGEPGGWAWNLRSIQLLELRLLKIKGVRLDKERLMTWWELQREIKRSSAAVITDLFRSALLEENTGFFVFESSPRTARRSTISHSALKPNSNHNRRRSSTGKSHPRETV